MRQHGRVAHGRHAKVSTNAKSLKNNRSLGSRFGAAGTLPETCTTCGGRQVIAQKIPSGLADRRENFVGHPVLERLGVFLVGPHGQLVEAALRYHGKTLCSSRGTHLLRALFVIMEGAEGIEGSVSDIETQAPADVRSYEPRFPVDHHMADSAVLELEDLCGPAWMGPRDPYWKNVYTLRTKRRCRYEYGTLSAGMGPNRGLWDPE